MIIVEVTLWPGGDPKRAKRLAHAEIANTGNGTATSGTYRCDLRLKRKAPWKSTRIDGFPRKRLNAWDLIFRCLRELVGDRNGEAAKDLPDQASGYWKQRALASEDKVETIRRSIVAALTAGPAGVAQLENLATVLADLVKKPETETAIDKLNALAAGLVPSDPAPRRNAFPIEEPLISDDLDEEDDS